MLKRILALFFVLPLFVLAQYPARPSNYVTDETGTLDAQQQDALNRKLRSFEDSTSNQLFVYITSTLNGREMGDLCQEIFHNWHIGSKGKNNGVLIAVFLNDHKFRIHTGYGLEGALPDQLTHRIQEEDMKPLFKQGDYYAGVDKGTDQLIYYTRHEYKPDESASGNDNWVGWLLGYGPSLVLLSILLYLLIGKKKQKSKPGLWYFLLIGGIIFSLIPCLGSVITFFMVGATLGWKSKGGGSYSSGSSYSSYDSSSSSSSYSSSSDSGSSFDGGGGGDSGGGGSNSDW
jgi:uncharacterized protein